MLVASCLLFSAPDDLTLLEYEHATESCHIPCQQDGSSNFCVPAAIRIIEAS